MSLQRINEQRKITEEAFHKLRKLTSSWCKQNGIIFNENIGASDLFKFITTVNQIKKATNNDWDRAFKPLGPIGNTD